MVAEGTLNWWGVLAVAMVLVTAGVCWAGSLLQNHRACRPASPEATQGRAAAFTWDDFFWALGEVESGNNDAAIGDGGWAAGRYQIHADYWRDAWRHRGSAEWSRDAESPSMARVTVLKYLDRHAPVAFAQCDWRTLARVHNGGPHGDRKGATRAYARKVLKAMQLARTLRQRGNTG